ncbi:MAG: hypothetical protein AAB676_19855 [Verrucomicrobiota bacterium]
MSVTITKIDPLLAVKAYAKERDAKERGRIYTDDIDPLLCSGGRVQFENLGMEFSNQLGTLSSDLISQRALSLIFVRLPHLTSMITDFKAETARLNQTIFTRKRGLPTVGDFGDPVSSRADEDVQLTLDKFRQAAYSYSATEINSTSRNIVEEGAEPLSAALGADIVDTVFALVTADFTSKTTIASASVDFGHITGACKAMNTAGVPGYKRTGVVNSDVAEALRNDELMIPNLSTDAQSAYAVWRMLQGFENVIEYPSLPGNSIYLTAFFFAPEALLLATRLPVNPAEMAGMGPGGYPGVLTRIVEPNSGFAVLNNLFVNASDFSITSRLLTIFGCARGEVACGHRFVSQ